MSRKIEMIDSRKMENFEDLFLILDIIFTIIAVMAGNLGNLNLSNIFFGLSGGSLILSLVFMIIKRFKKIRGNR